MESLQLHPSSLVLLFVFLFVLVFLSSAQEEECAPSLFECGSVKHSISYPFWKEGRPKHCAYEEYYKITCNETDNSSEIEIESRKYHVKEIDYENQTAIIVDKDYFGDSSSCHLPSTSTIDLNPNHFNYPTNGDFNLTFLYNCLPPIINDPDIKFLECLRVDELYAYLTFQPYNIPVPETFKGCQVIKTPILEANRYGLEESPVDFGDVLAQGFQVTWSVIDPDRRCLACVRSRGHCGFNETSHLDPTCYCNGQLHPATCPQGGAKNSPKKTKKKIIIGVSAGVGSSLACLIVFILFRFWYRNKRYPSTSSKLLSRALSSDPSLRSDLEKSNSLLPTQFFDYKELEEATNNFDSSKELGDGGFGIVYHGKLRDGRNVAVKRLYENNCRCVQQFKNEIKILSHLRHPNLVTLYGCSSRHSRELLLVYEYIPNGTVADHLHGDHAKPGALPWPNRMSIAIETSDALKYLHAVDIIHRDVKTNNILLDNNFHVKVADFGLSRLFPTDVSHISTAPQGTPGYVDPDYHRCYQLNDKSDVYSFGVVLIELISSKPAVDITRHRHEINLADMAINKIQNRALNELVDPTLGFDSDCGIRRMITSVAELAFRCLQDEKDIRPSMEEVLEVLIGIKSEEYKGERVEEVNTPAEDEVLLKEMPPLSPDTVTDAWESKTTTPNTSG